MSERTRVQVLSDRLVEARTAKKWTQAQLAERANVTQSFISQLERGEIDNAGWITIRQIEDALGLRPGKLTS